MNLIKISVTPDDTELCARERKRERARELMKKGVGV